MAHGSTYSAGEVATEMFRAVFTCYQQLPDQHCLAAEEADHTQLVRLHGSSIFLLLFSFILV